MASGRLVARTSDLPKEQEYAAVGFEIFREANGLKPAAVYQLHVLGEADYKDIEFNGVGIKNSIADMNDAAKPKEFLEAAKRAPAYFNETKAIVFGALPFDTSEIILDDEPQGNFLLPLGEDGYAEQLKTEIQDLKILRKFAEIADKTKVSEYIEQKSKKLQKDNGENIRRSYFKFTSLSEKIEKEAAEDKMPLLKTIKEKQRLIHEYNLKSRFPLNQENRKYRDGIGCLEQEKDNCECQKNNMYTTLNIARDAAKKTDHEKQVVAAINANISDLKENISNIQNSIKNKSGLVEESGKDADAVNYEISVLNNEIAVIQSEIKRLDEFVLQKTNNLRREYLGAKMKDIKDRKMLKDLKKNVEDAGFNLITVLDNVTELKKELIGEIEPKRYCTAYEVVFENGEKQLIVGGKSKKPTILKRIKKEIFGYVEPWEEDALSEYAEKLAAKQIAQGYETEEPKKDILPEIIDALNKDFWWAGWWKRDLAAARLEGRDTQNNLCYWWCF